MTDRSKPPQSLRDLPKARLEKSRKTYLFWLIPIGAAVLAGWFVYSSVFGEGPKLHIFFKDIAGLQAGKSDVKYRGARVGSVEDIHLTKDHQMVEVTVSLDKSAASLAREETRFWIVQPEIGVQQIRGLRTIVSGNYIAADPGGGKKQTRFMGLPQPPIEKLEGGEVRLLLLAEKLGSVQNRSPVFYRGVRVGEVIDGTLGPASQTVRITIRIKKHFAPLVRMNSRFWNAGGINVNIGLSGASIRAQSAQTLVSGGIAFATPDTSEKPAPAETSFRLYDKPEEAWLAWAPSIHLGPESSEPISKNAKPRK